MAPVASWDSSCLCITQALDTSFLKTAITLMNKDAENAQIKIKSAMKTLFQINPNKIS